MCWELTSLEAQWQVSSATALTLRMCASHIVWIGADVTIDPFTFAWMYNEAGNFTRRWCTLKTQNAMDVITKQKPACINCDIGYSRIKRWFFIYCQLPEKDRLYHKHLREAGLLNLLKNIVAYTSGRNRSLSQGRQDQNPKTLLK